MKSIKLFAIIFFLVSVTKLFSGTYSGGDGSAGDPYQLSTPDDIDELMSTTGDWGEYFIVTQDIDCNGYSGWTGSNPNPIGNSTISFTGSFHGMGNEVSNIDINKSTEDYIGFFGIIDNNVQNLILNNVNAIGDDYVGCFCGKNNGTIQNCSATGDATANDDYAGGFCGKNNGTIQNCSATGDATANDDYAGGFCALNSNGAIQNCSATGDVETNKYFAGGFCADNSDGTIKDCSATGDVETQNNYAGGFCAYYYGGSIENCYAAGSVDGPSNVGGFLGEYVLGSLSCCFWGFEGANLDDIGALGDNVNIIQLNPSQMTNPANFPCFDFENVWVMGDYVKVEEGFTPYPNTPILRALVNGHIIPTLSEWAVIAFIGLLAGVGGWFVWRRIV